MKKKISLIVFAFILMFATSCVTINNTTYKKKPVKKGWIKNTNNPHHPRTTNPGHTKNKNKSKHKHKSNGKNKH